ncbi:MAG: EAL domain-containing protein, partial [Actinobacteria bacterium]|nr:EAL domain-containing protein [Actinomycetota bacterium]
MAAVTAGLLLAVVPKTHSFIAPHRLPWWGLAVGFFVSEVLVIHLPLRRDAHSLSMSELPLVIGLFFSSPIAIVAARFVGAGSALVVHRRQRGVKLAFNLTQLCLESTVAVCVFSAFVGSIGESLTTQSWLAALGSILTVDLMGAVTVTTVIWLSEGSLGRTLLRQVLVSGSVAALINTTIGLLSVTTLWRDQAAGWLLAMLGIVLYLGFRAFASLTQRYVGLQQLYEFTRFVARSARAETSMQDMLERVRTLLRAEIAEVTLLAGDDANAVSITVGPDDTFASHEHPLGWEAEGTWKRAASGDRAFLIPRNTRDEGFKSFLYDQRLRDCMVVPLHDNSKVIGTLTVADRLGEVSTFDEEDLRLFEALANHVATSLANGRLIERLRAEAAEKEHQAHHDALTGLANRTLFHKRVHEAIAHARRADGRVAVMLMDLDRFKEINDTLGHHNGDTLLQEVAGRLAHAVGGSATIARLGGDEFAILVAPVLRPELALRVANDVLASLRRPFELDHLTLDVGGSIGVALFPEHGEIADTLLQRADVAMYSAKTSGRGVELYSPDSDQYSPRRLSLIGDLRRAIDRSELVLHYQPKVDLRSGKIVAAEALVRWKHPSFGFLNPDEFIVLAEQTGIIHQLTAYVLRSGLEECRRWLDRGLEIGVAVNISARNLVDTTLPDQVAELLAETAVDPALLTLEIVETSIMADPNRTLGVLDRLSAMGVGLSVDDFGTGYSSLSYLKRLPVTEVKIDKSFVLSMKDDPSDAAIVSSIVDLGTNLGLTVVAEGIEDAETSRRLLELGCRIGQG